MSTIDDTTGEPPLSEAPSVDRRLQTSGTQIVEVTGSGDVAAIVVATGGTVVEAVPGATLARVEGRDLATLASQPGISTVRQPVDRRRAALAAPHGDVDSVPSEAKNDRDQWTHIYGRSAQGVKVGIIDFFDPNRLAGQVSSGELAAIPDGQRSCSWNGTPCAFGTPGALHGNAVAEILSDQAPGATLYLAEAVTIWDYIPVIDWMAANGVTVISHSLGGPFDGPGDGTGTSAYIVDYAVSKGIAWFNAAGNAGTEVAYTSYQGGYWRQAWSDPDNDRWMNFHGTDESLGTYCGALMGLRWDDWTGGSSDYALYATDFRRSSKTNTTTKVLVSDWNQATGGALPIEGADLRWLCNIDPGAGPVYDLNKDGYISLWVYRTTRSTEPSAGDVIELMVNNGFFEYSSANGSAAIPFGDSRNPGAASVGAGAPNWANGFSAKGPTNDGRAKPDLIGLGCLQTSLDLSCFLGTSASAPLVAGIAAMYRGAFGDSAPWQLQRLLRDVANRTSLPTQRNDIGWGAPDLVEYPISPSVPAIPLMYEARTPQRVLDTRGAPWGPIGISQAVRVQGGTSISFALPQFTDLSRVDAIAVNVTIVGASGSGYVQLYPTAAAYPGAFSTVNTSVYGQVIPNFAVVRLGADQRFTLHSSITADLLVDLVGVFKRPFQPNYDGGIGRYHPTAPTTVLNSRTCLNMPGDCVGDASGPGTNYTIPVDSAGVPASASAVVVQVTADSPVLPDNFISALPFGTTGTPTTSTLNTEGGVTTTATTIVPMPDGSAGRIRLYVGATTHVQVVVVGWFSGHTGSMDTEGLFLPLVPSRALDSREPAPQTQPAAGATISVPITTLDSVPDDLRITGVLGNLTATDALSAGTIRGGRTSDLSASFASISFPNRPGSIANLLIAPTDDGTLKTVAPTGVAHRIVDVTGVFIAGDLPLTDGQLRVVSAANTDTPEAGVSGWKLSGNGRYVLVSSASGNLPGAVDDGGTRVFRWDLEDGSYELVAEYASGVGISDDGSRVAFLAGPNTVNVPGDTTIGLGLYIRDLEAGTTVAVTSSAMPSLANYLVSADDDLDRFAIIEDQLTEKPLYIRDVSAGTFTPVTVPYSLYDRAKITISGYGNRVALTMGNDFHLIDVAANADVYTFTIGELMFGGMSDDADKLLMYDRFCVCSLYVHDVSANSNAPVVDELAAPYSAMISGDGTRVSFTAGPGLAGRDYSPESDLYLYELATGHAEIVSRSATGAQPNRVFHTELTLSDDGKTVVFLSQAWNLLPLHRLSTMSYTNYLYAYRSTAA